MKAGLNDTDVTHNTQKLENEDLAFQTNWPLGRKISTRQKRNEKRNQKAFKVFMRRRELSD